MSRFDAYVSRNSGQNHRDGTRACVRESGHVPSRFPSRDAGPECPDLTKRGETHRMQDLRQTMEQAKTVKGMRTILKTAQRRLEDIQFIGWPALEESLQAELDDCRAISDRRMQASEVTS